MILDLLNFMRDSYIHSFIKEGVTASLYLNVSSQSISGT